MWVIFFTKTGKRNGIAAIDKASITILLLRHSDNIYYPLNNLCLRLQRTHLNKIQLVTLHKVLK